MVFKSFRFKLIIRLGLLVLFIFSTCWFIKDAETLSLGFISLVLVVIQAVVLFYFIERSQKDIVNFLGFIQYDDFSVTYPIKNHSGMTKKLYEEYNRVILKFRALRTEKESNLHFFRSILQHNNIGILAFNHSGEIKLINTSALRLLELNRLDNINKLEILNPEIYSSILALKPRQKLVLKVAKVPEPISISISANEIIVNGEEIKSISLQNIQSELEEKEMEAWQNMIKVMTHEIMNSLTPITSLASTISDEMSTWHNIENSTNAIPVSETKDMYLAVSTIKKRSEGLLHFVEDFRNLSQIPKPKPELFPLKSFFEHLLVLMKKDFEKHSISVFLNLVPDTIKLMADASLMEPLIINLFKNTIESFVDIEHEKTLTISALYNSESKIEIWIEDNGIGIIPEVLEKIFIPFFTTKKTGSGIGLSVCKQIMRSHAGVIIVNSEYKKGTTVKLIF
jgi:two-component system, NtrC family, nitrogen regulation sensor histidine kinase NtrY